MASNGTKFKINFDRDRLIHLVIRQSEQAMDKAAKRLVDIMQKEALMPSSGGGPGRPEWRKEVSDMIKLVSKMVTATTLEYVVGYTGADTVVGEMKAWIVDSGIGPEGASKERIWAGPYGRPVFDDDLAPSRSKVVRAYPLPFSQAGNEWLQNAYDIFANEYREILVDELNRLTGRDLASCLTVTVLGRQG